MKKNYFLRKLMFLLIALSISGITMGQSTANYVPNLIYTGDLIDMSSGTTDLIATGSYSEDVASSVTNIGFNFCFMGTLYSQFSINSNGQMRLGSTNIGGSKITTFGLNIPYIVPISDDNAIMATGKVHYKVDGSAPNRILVVEWKNLRIPFLDNTGTGSLVQALLYETTGKIEFRYGTMYFNGAGAVRKIFFSSSNADPYMGFINSIITTPAYVYTGASMVNTSFLANSSMTNLNSAADGSRTVFTFTPPQTPPADPTNLNFSAITSTSMTLSWTDNASNEVGYSIYRSTDGTNYSLITTRPASSTSYNATGLTHSTIYYWRIYAFTEGMVSVNLDNNTTTHSPISGAKTVGGTTPDYATLTDAFAAISADGLGGPVELKLQASTTETFPLALPTVATLTNTITIYPTANDIVITGASATGLFNFNGASYITFDGRVNKTQTTNNLTISNTSTGYVIQFINDASNNIIEYCSIQGATTATSLGLINFSTSTGTTGNDNNLVDYCNISPAPASTYAVGVYSSGTTAKENSNNTISNCNIYNFFINAGTGTYAGISINGSSTDWTITGNSFYQTGTVALGTGGQLNAIYTNNPSTGYNFVITNNYFGGSTSNCGSTPWTQNAATTNIFMAIRLSVASASIQGNVIRNISQTTITASSNNSGITVLNGAVNIGNISGNTIGSTTTAGSITIANGGGNGGFRAIQVGTGSTTPGAINISNNIIDGITLSSTSSAPFRGIDLGTNTGFSYTVNNNTIGGGAAGISVTTTGAVTGIYSGAPATSQPISNNILQNITYSGSGQMVGIYHQNTGTSVFNTTGNTIRNLSSNSTSTGSGTTSSIIGIYQAGSTGNGHIISTNTIYNLSNTSGSTAANICGIVFNSAGTGCEVSRNSVYNFTLATTAVTASITGIYINAGTTTYSNNMICLGNGVTTGYIINGINEAAGTDNVYFNSIYIGGSASSDQSTYAFNSNVTTNTRSFRDNIFVNARSNAGTGYNFAVKVGGTSANPAGLTIDYNVYLANGTNGVFGYYNSANVASLAAWQTAVGQDAHSINSNPLFVDPTNSTPDLHIQNSSPADLVGIDIPAITIDFDGQTRANYTPYDIGADAHRSTITATGTGGDWNNPSTWVGGVPSATDDVVICAGMTVTIPATKASVSCKDLTLAPLANLTIAGSGGELTVTGNLVIQSDATGSGSLIENGTLTVTGTKSVQLYLPTTRWYYFSIPVTTANASVISSDLSIDKLYEYNTPGSAWSQITNGATALSPTKGYALKLAGTPKTITFTGTLYNNNFSPLPISNTGNNWWLLGNSYPSSIDWYGPAPTGFTLTNIGTSVYVRTNGVFDVYTYSDNTALLGGSRYTPPMQAFWVKVTGAGPAFAALNTARVHSTKAFIKAGNEVTALRLRITRENYIDETLIKFNENAENGFDVYDADKFFTNDAYNPEIFTIGDDLKLAMNALSALEERLHVQLGFKTPVAGDFIINTSEMESLEGYNAYLYDRTTNQYVNLNLNPVYNFTSDATENIDRFAVYFFRAMTDNEITDYFAGLGIDPTTNQNISVYSYSSDIFVTTSVSKGKIMVYDITGRVITSAVINSNLSKILMKQAGYYLVKVITAAETVTRKVYIR